MSALLRGRRFGSCRLRRCPRYPECLRMLIEFLNRHHIKPEWLPDVRTGIEACSMKAPVSSFEPVSKVLGAARTRSWSPPDGSSAVANTPPDISAALAQLSPDGLRRFAGRALHRRDGQLGYAVVFIACQGVRPQIISPTICTRRCRGVVVLRPQQDNFSYRGDEIVGVEIPDAVRGVLLSVRRCLFRRRTWARPIWGVASASSYQHRATWS